MIKKLLSASLLVALATSAAAYDIDSYVYTPTQKFKITGDNIVTNGKFTEGSTGTEGWNAIDETNYPLASVFEQGVGGPNSSNTLKVLSGQTALTAGAKQVIAIEAGGYYVVTFRVMGTAAGYTDLDQTGGNTNYINAYYNTDGELATVNGTNLLFGTDGVNGGYQFSFDNSGFSEHSFAINAPANGFIVIDFRGLSEGLEIADVECHAASEVYDDRVAERRLNYIQTVLDGVKAADEAGGVQTAEERDGYSDLKDAIDEMKTGIESGASDDELTGYLANVNLMWDEYVAANLSNVLDLIPTTDGSSNTGNNSANWMNWTGKFNNLTTYYTGKAPWSFTTDRLHHKGGAANTPMGIQWMRSSSGSWDNIATLTATLDGGTYFWGLSASGGMMTLNKNRWARSMAKENMETTLFFNGDTTDVFTLDPAVTKDYIFKYTLAEEKEVKLGFRSNTNIAASNGVDASFYSPVLYKLIVAGALTPEQKAYIEAANTQLEALAGRIQVAQDYLAETQTALPWGKEDLQVGVTEAQARYDAWKALTQEQVLAMMDEDKSLRDTIMNSGVRFLNNNYITPFVNKNAPLTNMPTAIASATATKNQRIYSSSAKMADLEAKIAEAQAMYDEKLVAAFSSEDSLALVNEKAALEAAVVEFQNAITPTEIVNIDFSNDFVTHEDATGETDTYYTIAGEKGEMKFTDISGSYCYAKGYSGDSLGVLRVGNSAATVEFTGALPKASDIVNIKFDLYVGNLSGKSAGFFVESAAGDTITGLFFSKYSGTTTCNPMNIDYNSKINGVGSSSQSNLAIAAASNKTSFDIVLDYGARQMYCTTSNSSKGTATTEAVDLKNLEPTKFVLMSNYNNADRRCWFDNLIIQTISAGETAIQGVGEVKVVTKTGAKYNVAGQQITTPAAGQIYIQNGVKYVAE